MVVSMGFVRLWIFFLFGIHLITAALGWSSSDKIKLTDVNVVSLHQGKMTNSRRTHPVPQLQCVGGTAGCSAFTPRVVQCYNRGSDGYDVQWECKADMDSQYRFGDIAVNCEGYNYPDDPYILKGSCGLEYTIDIVNGGNNYQHSHHRDQGRHSYHHNYHKRHSGSWFGTIIMWGVIALIVYYVYQHWAGTATRQYAQTPEGHTQFTNPPPPGFRPEYVPGNEHTTSFGTQAGVGSGGGFWSGAATGGLLGYLFGSSRNRNQYYNDYGYYGPTYHQRGPGYGGYGGYGGSSWFGSNNSWTSGWSSSGTHRRSPSPASTRTASGFGGTKRR